MPLWLPRLRCDVVSSWQQCSISFRNMSLFPFFKFHFYLSSGSSFWSHFPCLNSFVLSLFFQTGFILMGLHFSGGSCIWKKLRTIELLIIIILCPFRASFIWEYQSICQTGIHNYLHHTRKTTAREAEWLPEGWPKKTQNPNSFPLSFSVSQSLGPLGSKEKFGEKESKSPWSVAPMEI